MSSADYQDRVKQVRQETQGFLQCMRVERAEKARQLREKLRSARNDLIKQRPANAKAVPNRDDVDAPKLDAVSTPANSGAYDRIKEHKANPSSNLHENPQRGVTAFADGFPEGFEQEAESRPQSMPRVDHDETDETNQSIDYENENVSIDDPKTSFDGKDGSLLDIHGMGAGMVWRLKQIGVTSPADLAASDIGDLTDKLGAVARLAPLKKWQEDARNLLS